MLRYNYKYSNCFGLKMIQKKYGRVYIDITESEFQMLLLAVGVATGATDNRVLAIDFLSMVNSMMAGSAPEDWTPYKVPRA